MQKRNLFVRIMAIVLCVIMVLGVVATAFYAFAAEEGVLPETGSPNNTWVIAAVAVALLVLVSCIVVPKIKKK